MWSTLIVTVNKNLYHEVFEEELARLKHYVPSLEDAEIVVYRSQNPPEFGWNPINSLVQYAESRAFKRGKDKADYDDLRGKSILVVSLEEDVVSSSDVSRGPNTLGLHPVIPLDPNRTRPCSQLEFIMDVCSEVTRQCPSLLKVAEGCVMIYDNTPGELFKHHDGPFTVETCDEEDDQAGLFIFQSLGAVPGDDDKSKLAIGAQWRPSGLYFLNSKFVTMLLNQDQFYHLFSCDGVDSGRTTTADEKELLGCQDVFGYLLGGDKNGCSSSLGDSEQLPMQSHLGDILLRRPKLHGVALLGINSMMSCLPWPKSYFKMLSSIQPPTGGPCLINVAYIPSCSSIDAPVDSQSVVSCCSLRRSKIKLGKRFFLYNVNFENVVVDWSKHEDVILFGLPVSDERTQYFAHWNFPADVQSQCKNFDSSKDLSKFFVKLDSLEKLGSLLDGNCHQVQGCYIDEALLNFSFPGFVQRMRDINIGLVFMTMDYKGVPPEVPHLRSLAHDPETSYQLLSKLDSLAASSTTRFDCCRALSAIAELLYARAAAAGFKGPRSGPAKNESFQEATRLLLQDGSFAPGIAALTETRDSFLQTPRNFLRMSRHYDRAVQSLISDSVCFVSEHIKLEKTSEALPDFGTWVTATSPARIDLAGGWTDTPPICCDFGGKVCGLAVTVDGKRPIGSKTSRIRKCEIRLALGNHSGGSLQSITVSSARDMEDYSSPGSPGALLKACIVYSGMVPKKWIEERQQDLADFLAKKYGGGFEIHSWSNLPEGSGMGTSSILAGCILATLWTSMGLTYTRMDLIHAVLMVEQYLTTGGGWQDQVNGLLPGIKLGSSEKSEKLKVSVEILGEEDGKFESFFDKLQEHIILVFTGEVRLAKNLLQDVIRQWYIGSSEIPDALKANFRAAEKCWEACKNECIGGIGKCLREIWTYKKILAKGAETPVSKAIAEACKELTYGESLAGAGGGGFMVLITKKPDMLDKVRKILKEKELGCTCHRVTIDRKGIEVMVGEEEVDLQTGST